jgi:DNA-binding NtrC family response regulator
LRELVLPPPVPSSRLEQSVRASHRAGLCVIYTPCERKPQPVVVIEGEPLIIGRASEAHISLREDASVSRHHARVERRGDDVFITDLGSSNGTWVHGVRVKEARLMPHAVIRVGNSMFRFAASDVDTLARHRDPALPQGSLVGGAAMRALYAELAGLARGDDPLLIRGERGTGKELVARELHALGGAHGEFVVVHCAALREAQLATLLSTDTPDSALAQAAGGTLFLADVDALSLDLQRRLLGLLGARDAARENESSVRRQVRIVCASQRDLARSASRGTFRPDLYARLSQATLTLPALRDRREDLVPLVRHVLDKVGVTEAKLSIDFIHTLARYDFPGNVSELAQVVSAAAHLAKGQPLLATHLPKDMLRATDDDHDPFTVGEPTATARMPRSGSGITPSEGELRAVLHKHQGDLVEVSREFGKDRLQVRQWLRRYGIDASLIRG